ncbi:MAG: prepilin-type N-terminal cleavage/methylation domain-containing protein [Acidobacteriota bacterium]
MRLSRNQRGFSMIEVLVALGLLGAVLIAITSLFILGGQRVRQGRERTEALSVATHLMETLDNMSYRGLYSNFTTASDPGAAAGPQVIDSRTNAEALTLGWQALIDSKLDNGYAQVTITRIGGTTFRTASGLRATTTVYWDDLNKTRNLTLETVRY